MQKVPDKVKLSKWTGASVPEKNTVLGSNWLPPPVVIAVKIPLPTSPSAVECEDGVDRWAPCRSKGVIGRQPCVLSLPPSLPAKAGVYTWTPVYSSHSLQTKDST